MINNFYLLQKFEKIYNEQLTTSQVTQKAQFEYAWCLVRSRYPADVRKGIVLLEDLFNNHKDCEKRDCLYYLAIGNARIKVFILFLIYFFNYTKHLSIFIILLFFFFLIRTKYIFF